MKAYTAFLVLASAATPSLAAPRAGFSSLVPTQTQGVFPRDGAAAATGTVAPSTTSAPAVFCHAFQDPDASIVGGYCTCSDGGKYSFATGTGEVCPYTSPVPASLSVTSVSTAVDPACTDGANPDSSCFESLGLADYIQQWWDDNEDDCGESSGFADCWYAKKTDYSPSTCDQLNVDPACEQPKWVDFKDTGDDSFRDFYVSWTIWNTQGFFLDLYNAVGGADQTVQDGLSSVVTLLDPPQETNEALNYVLDALTFGLSLYSEGSVPVKALIRTAPQTTSLLGKLYPDGTVDQQFSTWSEVADNVGKLTSTWKDAIADGLGDIANNVTVFNIFNGQSDLSGIRPSLNSLENSMSQSLNTYAISAIMNELSLVASRGMDTDVNALQTNGTGLYWDTGCGDGYDEYGICAEWFYDGVDSFAISSPDHLTKSYHDVLEAFFNGSDPLTTGELLFSDAYRCVVSSGTNGGATPSVDPEDPSSVSCLSTLRICTWTIYTLGPFSDCPNLPDSDAALPRTGVSGCIGPSGDTDENEAIAYLGGGILKDGPGEWAYNAACDNVDV